MKYYDVIIIGGGASGCICALTASNLNKKILIIDKLNKIGKKILATGNGRCNLSNINISKNYIYNCDVEAFINKFNVSQTLDFFKKCGLLTFKDEEGRIYPFSNSAKSVVDVINNAMSSKKNINLSLENEVEKIQKEKDKFIVYTKKENFLCNKLIIAVGSKNTENLLKNLNINYKPFVPSLVALKTQNTRYLENIKVSNVLVTAICGEHKYSEIGEVLFKDNGLSGISIFNISTLFARQNNFSGKVILDLMPNFSQQQIKQLLENRKSLNIKISNLFDGIFVTQIGYHILNTSPIKDEDRFVNELTDREIQTLAYQIKNLTFEVKGHYDNNQVFSGGVELKNLTECLESKQIKNLYFCGEVCDVDGICGGYNLQWAWTSGHIVGENL